ncbi:hypothetical protein [Runella sp.]|uniref:hypothetical protein n=1 Tax=Runella sp. TaxID=1960881 RepID=UPI003D0D6F57
MVAKAFTGLLDGLKSIDIAVLVKASVEAHKAEIEDLNIEQLNAGQDATGHAITPPYVPFTIIHKQAKNQPTDRVTLKDEGSFHKSIFVKTHQNAFEMDATDPKTAALVGKYGEEILGLTDKNIDETAEIIEETLVKSFEQKFDNSTHAFKEPR